MNKIVRHLFQGNIDDAILASKTKSADWIIYLGQSIPLELSHESEAPIIHIPLKDGDDDIHKWEIANQVIFYCERNGKTLVACRGGISRSPMMCLFFLLKNKFQTNFDEALDYIKFCIPEFQPEQSLIFMVKEMIK